MLPGSSCFVLRWAVPVTFALQPHELLLCIASACRVTVCCVWVGGILINMRVFLNNCKVFVITVYCICN